MSLTRLRSNDGSRSQRGREVSLAAGIRSISLSSPSSLTYTYLLRLFGRPKGQSQSHSYAMSQPTAHTVRPSPSPSSSSDAEPSALLALWVLLSILVASLVLWAACYLIVRKWHQARGSRSDVSDQGVTGQADRARRLGSKRSSLSATQQPTIPLRVMVKTTHTVETERRPLPSTRYCGRNDQLDPSASSSLAALPSSTALPSTPASEHVSTRPNELAPDPCQWPLPPPPPRALRQVPSLGQVITPGHSRGDTASVETRQSRSQRTGIAAGTDFASRQVSWYEATRNIALVDPSMWTVGSGRLDEEDDEAERETSQG